jgi:hypothetical protein
MSVLTDVCPGRQKGRMAERQKSASEVTRDAGQVRIEAQHRQECGVTGPAHCSATAPRPARRMCSALARPLAPAAPNFEAPRIVGEQLFRRCRLTRPPAEQESPRQGTSAAATAKAVCPRLPATGAHAPALSRAVGPVVKKPHPRPSDSGPCPSHHTLRTLLLAVSSPRCCVVESRERPAEGIGSSRCPSEGLSPMGWTIRKSQRVCLMRTLLRRSP